MKISVFALFAIMALIFPLTATAASDVDDVTMTMIDDDDTSHEGTEVGIPGDDDSLAHDEEHSDSSSDDDIDHDSDDDANDEDENESDEDENETEDSNESDEIEDSEDDSKQAPGNGGPV